MNRTDRLFAIILELQHHKYQRAEDLAATFEVSKRTIYRDIQALSEAGVPLISETGPGNGYSIIDGYFLPPIRFTLDEAFLLILGSDFTAQQFDSHYRQAAIDAQRKIAALLSDEQSADMDYLRESISFLWATHQENPQLMNILHQLRQAVIEKKSVQIDYHKLGGNSDSSNETLRVVDPHGLSHHGGAWYLIAHCHLRDDTRFFRLSRIKTLSLLDQTFSRPTKFNAAWRKPSQVERNVEIKVLFQHEILGRLAEAPSFYITDTQPHPDGLMVTLRVRHEQDVLHWLLGWGRHIRVIDPPTLRQRLADEAAAIYQQHTDG